LEAEKDAVDTQDELIKVLVRQEVKEKLDNF